MGPHDVRRRPWIFLPAALTLPATGAAMWARLTDEQLLASSDLVVTGEWAGQVAAMADGQRLARDIGVLVAAEVLKGNLHGDVALVSVSSPSAPRSSSAVAYRRGECGLWLLQRRPGPPLDMYAADDPQRFVASATDGPRIEALRRKLGR